MFIYYEYNGIYHHLLYLQFHLWVVAEDHATIDRVWVLGQLWAAQEENYKEIESVSGRHKLTDAADNHINPLHTQGLNSHKTVLLILMALKYAVFIVDSSIVRAKSII